MSRSDPFLQPTRRKDVALVDITDEDDDDDDARLEEDFDGAKYV